jgi:hypothetical protein
MFYRHTSMSSFLQKRRIVLFSTQEKRIKVCEHDVHAIRPESNEHVVLRNPDIDVYLQDITVTSELCSRYIAFSSEMESSDGRYAFCSSFSLLSVGDEVLVFAKMLHTADPTVLRLRQIAGEVSQVKLDPPSPSICVGKHVFFEENIALSFNSAIASWQTDLVVFKKV